MKYYLLKNNSTIFITYAYVSCVYYSTRVGLINYNKGYKNFLNFLTHKNLLKVYKFYYPRKPGGTMYSSIFPQVITFFTTLAWTKPGFYIIFTISKVIIPDFGAVYILKPRFLFSYIFLVLHFYVVEVLELNTIDGTGLGILDGMELSEVKSGGYYIMCGDILFSPIRSDDWERLTKDKTLSKRVPPFIFRILYNYYCLNIHKINMSQSKKCYLLLYNKGRHRWSLSAKI